MYRNNEYDEDVVSPPMLAQDGSPPPYNLAPLTVKNFSPHTHLSTSSPPYSQGGLHSMHLFTNCPPL